MRCQRLAIGLLLGSILCGGALAHDRPNIVVILADDLGFGDLACFGHPFVQTPHLDALAQRGLRLSNFYSAAPVCSPTRASLLTGQVPQRHGLTNVIEVGDDHTHLCESAVLLPQILKQHGYKTAAFGKWHVGAEMPYRPRQRGFDVFVGGLLGGLDYYRHDFIDGRRDLWQDNTPINRDNQYITDIVADEAARFIQGHAAEPFFLYVAFHAVHTSMGSATRNQTQAPDAWLQQYAQIANAQGITTEKVRMVACASAMDAGVGRIAQALDEAKLTGHTIVVFTSDNGPVVRAGGSAGTLRGEKHSLWEGGIRVPTIVSWPDRLPAAEKREVVGITHDLLPTLLAAAEIETPRELISDGQNLLPAWADAQVAPERTLYWSYVRDSLDTRERAVRRGPWKWLNGELYQLADDPGETNDLAATHPEIAEKLAGAWRAWVGQFPEELKRWDSRTPKRKPTKSKGAAAS